MVPDRLVHPPARRYANGLSLIEAVFAIAITSIALVAALDLVASTARARSIHVRQSHGTALARELMAEILQSSYADPSANWEQSTDDGKGGLNLLGNPDLCVPPLLPGFGRECGETDGTRANFDDVDDYHSWLASPPETKDGTPNPYYTGWTRRVTIGFATVSNPGGYASLLDTGIKRIKVTVIDPDGRETTMTALRSRYSSYEQPPRQTTTYVNWVRMELQVGQRRNDRLQTGTHLVNRVSIPQ